MSGLYQQQHRRCRQQQHLWLIQYHANKCAKVTQFLFIIISFMICRLTNSLSRRCGSGQWLNKSLNDNFGLKNLTHHHPFHFIAHSSIMKLKSHESALHQHHIQSKITLFSFISYSLLFLLDCVLQSSSSSPFHIEHLNFIGLFTVKWHIVGCLEILNFTLTFNSIFSFFLSFFLSHSSSRHTLNQLSFH